MFQYNRNLLHLTSGTTPPPVPPTPVGGPLCFTANTTWSAIYIEGPTTTTPANLLVSTDGINWRTYIWTKDYNWVGETIALDNVGDKVYFKNQDSITTLGSVYTYHTFRIWSGSVSASGDVTYLLNPNGTTTVGNYAFYGLFEGCTGLTTAPELPATTLGSYCYRHMFLLCSSLTTPPKLPATTLADYCYSGMFFQCRGLTSIPELPATNIPNSAYSGMFERCSKIKISTRQTGNFQTPYRIPSSGTGTVGSNSLLDMFYGTGGAFTGTPTENTTYYTSNSIVSST